MPNSIRPLNSNRSGLLFLNGILYMLLFIIFELTPVPPSTTEALKNIPIPLRPSVISWLWLIGGMFQIGVSRCKKNRRVYENAGFAVGIFLPMLWGVLFSISALYGSHYGFLTGFFSFSYGLIIMYVSGWPNVFILKRNGKGALSYDPHN